MTKNIAIVGAGAADLRLGLYLPQHDLDATIFTDRRPEEYGGMRPDAGRSPQCAGSVVPLGSGWSA
jgi:ribulose 1,5-bisphosphate synthetase/thiazole synthase